MIEAAGENKITEVEKYGKGAQGKKEIIKHLYGKRLTLLQAIKAKCYDCMGFYGDGKVDCQIPDCPLYPFMVYGKAEKPKRRIMPNAVRKAAVERLAKARLEKQVGIISK